MWFRKQGVPLIIPARQRTLDAFPRSVPWILWAGIMHICYIFLRDIILMLVEDANGSLPDYIKALTSDNALRNEVLSMIVLGGIFLVMPVISGVLIALTHKLMVRTPTMGTNHPGVFQSTRNRNTLHHKHLRNQCS